MLSSIIVSGIIFVLWNKKLFDPSLVIFICTSLHPKNTSLGYTANKFLKLVKKVSDSNRPTVKSPFSSGVCVVSVHVFNVTQPLNILSILFKDEYVVILLTTIGAKKLLSIHCSLVFSKALSASCNFGTKSKSPQV